MGVYNGSDSATDIENLRVCFVEITAEVTAAKSEILELSLHYQAFSPKPTLKM